MVPALQLLGWQSALGTAGITSVMFLMIPSHEALNWDYVFNRALDTAVGCGVALAVGLLFWPRRTYDQLRQSDSQLRTSLASQLQHYHRWQAEGGSPPLPLNPAPLTATLHRMDDLIQRERRGPRHQRLRTSGWERRLKLWQQAHLHWLAWERLMASLPAEAGLDCPLLADSVERLQEQLQGRARPTPGRDPRPWQALAQQRHWPLLPLLALAEEWRPLHASLGALGRCQPC